MPSWISKFDQLEELPRRMSDCRMLGHYFIFYKLNDYFVI